jgi:hypothetical protein
MKFKSTQAEPGPQRAKMGARIVRLCVVHVGSWVLAASFASSVSCKRSEPPSSESNPTAQPIVHTPEVASNGAAAPSGTGAPPGPAPVDAGRRASFASFDQKSILLLCMDISAVTEKALDPVAEKKDGPIRIKKPCQDQFKDRLVLAMCTVQGVAKPDAGVGGSMVIYYYDFDTVDANDVEMKGCLTMSGDWQAISRDSDEYRRARVRRDAQRLVDLGSKATAPRSQPRRTTPDDEDAP